MNTPDFTKLKTNQWNEKYFMRYYNEFYNWLLPQYSFANTFTEKIYCYLNDIHNRPVCKTCGTPIKFKSITKGYSQYCSAKCRANNEQIKEKTKNTCLEKYGVTNNLHIVSVQKEIDLIYLFFNSICNNLCNSIFPPVRNKCYSQFLRIITRIIQSRHCF
jgi:hypothetical protein